MNWREIWAITVGADPGVRFLHPILAAILFYTIAYLLCLILYTISNQICPKSMKIYVLDFFKTLVVCAYPYGHGLVRSVSGHIGYCAVAVPLGLITVYTFKEGSPSPLSVFQDFLAKKISLANTLVRIVIQTAAGFASFRLVQLIWALEMHDDHVKSLMALTCDSDLKVSMFVGFLIEMCAVLYDNWLSLQGLSKFTILDDAIKTLNGAILVCLGLHCTGMYMHPAMASGLSFSCKGTSAWEHIIVYWIGGFLGCYGSIILNDHINFSLVSEKKNMAPNNNNNKYKNGVNKSRSKRVKRD